MPYRKKTQLPDIPQDEIKRLVRRCLTIKNWEYRDLAEHAGYVRGTVANLLSEKGTISMETLRKWCEALDYPLSDILAGIEYAPPESIDALRKEVKALREELENLKRRFEAHVE